MSYVARVPNDIAKAFIHGDRFTEGIIHMRGGQALERIRGIIQRLPELGITLNMRKDKVREDPDLSYLPPGADPKMEILKRRKYHEVIFTF